MRTVLATLAVLAALGAAVGVAVVGLGLYNVSARSGHLAVTEWALHTTYQSAVRLRAPAASEVPDLADPAMVELGARHFDSACRFCHAAPGEPRTATAQAMEPAPPHVVEAVAEWEPRHLGWIVHNGVKMSGMPAWPADRQEEVWPVVALLEAARGMDAAGYAALTAQTEDEPVAYCAGCHGMDGVGDLGPRVPRLDIQGADYLTTSLDAYREGRRASGFMQHAASAVAPEVLARAVEHYAGQQPGPSAAEADQDLAAEGAALAAAGTGDDDVPACRACHGPEPTRQAPGTPSLSGQHEAYLRTQLELWRGGERGGGARANLMHVVAQDLTDHEIAALAAYYASLRPAKIRPVLQ